MPATIAQNLFLQLLDRHLADARIRVLVNGDAVIVGQGGRRSDDHGRNESDIELRVHHPRFFARVLAAGNLGMGESFMDGDFEVDGEKLPDFLQILLRNRLDKKIRRDLPALIKILGVRALSVLRGKQRNVQRHYDIGDDLFEAFLDSSWTYSCGYAQTPEDSPDQLQFNKLDRICRKLELQPGEHLLDIGCGFGGLLIHAARHYGARGTGVTISQHHCERARRHVREAELGERVEIKFEDFRALTGHYDKVASIGMMEHVPRREYSAYFRNIARALAPQGLGLVHTIGCNAARNKHDPFIQKYIFPGSNQPRLSEIALHLEKHGLPILDVENMIRHYGPTIRGWLASFKQNRARLDSAKYDERFMRMWEYYLACGVAASFASDGALYQALFTNDYAAPRRLQRV